MKFFIITFLIFLQVSAIAQSNDLKIVIIRHGEKPKLGDNLNCKGFNRSLLLPKVIVEKFGVPSYSYVPAVVGAEATTKHSRMFQTITPLAVKYNLQINSLYNGKDSAGLAIDVLQKRGTVLIVWDHKNIVPLVNAFGIHDYFLKWQDDDFDSIWIITFNNEKAALSKDREGLMPEENCK